MHAATALRYKGADQEYHSQTAGYLDAVPQLIAVAVSRVIARRKELERQFAPQPLSEPLILSLERAEIAYRVYKGSNSSDIVPLAYSSCLNH